MLTQRPRAKNPLIALLSLVLYMLIGTAIFTMLSLLLAKNIYGISKDHLWALSTNGVSALKLIQILSTFGTFIIPAIAFAYMQNKQVFAYLDLNVFPSSTLVLLGATIMIASGPVLAYIIAWNQQMHFPSFLRSLETWMRDQENKMTTVTQQFLIMKYPSGFFLNVWMIALLPAIGEELIFRGCFQKIIFHMYRHMGLAIWVTALVFSCMHLQFYGFIPRLLLGGFMGYLYAWSKSLWLPILMHFVNNFLNVLLAFYYQMMGVSLDQLYAPPAYSWYVYGASLLLTMILIGLLYKKSMASSEKHLDP